MGQWVKGKSCETFNPCGPWLVTPDEVDLDAGLDLWLDVNGERRQTGSTRDMIFDVATIIEYLSTVTWLEPGDIIATGTPAGIGAARTPPRWLRPGDLVRIEIEKVGVLENPVVAES